MSTLNYETIHPVSMELYKRLRIIDQCFDPIDPPGYGRIALFKDSEMPNVLYTCVGGWFRDELTLHVGIEKYLTSIPERRRGQVIERILKTHPELKAEITLILL